MDQTGACPTCGRPLARADRVCTACGYRRGGVAIETRVGEDCGPASLTETRANWIILLGGITAELLLFGATCPSAVMTRAFASATFLAWIAVAALVRIGWQDDGIIGVFWELRFPLGALNDPSWRRLTVALLLVLAAVLTGVLISAHPHAIPPGWWGLRPAHGP